MFASRMLSRWINSRTTNRSRRSTNRVARLRLAPLEERAVPTTFTVNTLVDENDGIGVGGISLRDAVNAANADGSAGPHIINFSVTGDINLTNNHILINAPSGLTITGPGAANLSVKGAATAGTTNRIFDINVAAGNPTITISGMTLADGNVTTNLGGAIRIHNDPVVIDSVTFNNNKSTAAGGAIATTSAIAANLTINNSEFTANKGSTGGVLNGTSTITLNISNTTFGSNTSTSNGGAIHLASNATVTLNTSTFTNNTASSNGGAISNGGTATWTITKSTFTGNQGPAGGVFRFAGTATVSIEDSTMSGNSSTTGVGGAIYFVSGGSLALTNSTVNGNTATTAGGGLSTASTAVTITNSTISGNTANSATLGGGGISLSTGVMTINNSTITGNMAPGATASGGGIRKTSATGTLTLNSTIVGANTASSGGQDIHATSAITVAGGDNLVQDVVNGAFTLSGTNITGVDPMLDGLADNGGPTFTHKLLPGSPAFHTGNNLLGLSFDQRGMGFPRVVGSGPDIGSVETVSVIPSAKGTAANVPPANPTFTVTVDYTDETGINTGGIGLGDIRISGPAFPTPLAPFSATPGGSGMMVTGTYEFNAPVGGWQWFHNGVYSIEMQANEVFDTDGPNAVPAGKIGMFTVTLTLPSPLVVDNAGDFDDGDYSATNLTLREAINLSNLTVGETDTINFAGSLTGTPINLGSVIKITDPVVITGSGAANISISGGGVTRIFDLNIPGVGGEVALTGMTLTNGNATAGTGGAIVLTDEGLTLSGMVLSNNTITGTGGAIGATGAATLTIGNSTFSSNTASSSGGAINTAGAVSITINNSVFSGNTSSSTGGAIQTASTVTLDISDSKFTGNQGTTGGALRFGSSASTVTINRSTLSGNIASTGRGGGLYFNLAGDLQVNYSTFSGNTAATSGGGLTIWSGTATITNSTISGNTANGTSTHGGGGISISSTGTLTLNNSTVTGNNAASNFGGGILDVSASGTVTINSSIVAGNTASTGGQDIHNSTTTTLNVGGSNNLIQDDVNGNFTLSGFNVTGVSPNLSPLTNNGGPTETHALMSSSQAFNNGINPLNLPFDQRGTGFPRQAGTGIDIGAFDGFTLDPSAKAMAPDVPPTLGTITVTVDYADETGINTGGIDVNDIKISGPGFAMAISPTSATPSGGGMMATGTYTFDAPVGGWQWFHNGKYTIEMQPGQVFDTDGPNAVPAGPIGSFTVNIALPSPLVVDNAGDLDDGVYTPGNFTLREAINLTNDELGSNTISFAGSLNGQTIALGSVLKITDLLVVTGPGAANLTLSGGGSSRIFEVNVTGVGGDVSISGLTLSGGNATTGTGGAISLVDENLTLTGMVLTSNTITGTGGAIGSTGAATLAIGSSTFTSNTSSSTGGVINTAGAATISINASMFSNNMSTGSSGGVLQTTSTVTLDVNDSTFTLNQGTQGGALRFGSGSSTVTINRSTLSGNTATSSAGGGLYFNLGGMLEVNDSTFSGNTAGTTGGGFTIWSATATVTNSTISGNTANGTGTSGGGGISISSSGSLTVNNSTITGNNAASGVGGGIRKSSATGTLTINSTIVAANTSSTGGPDINAPTGTPTAIAGVGYNLIGISDLGNFTLSGTNQTGTSGSPLSPMLDVLANYGGPTETHRLQSGSPAFNNGNNGLGLSFDQRGTGFARTVGSATDIGAFEGFTVIPSAKATLPNVPPADPTYTVVVEYSDETAINTGSIDVNDVRLSGPGFAVPVAPISATPSGSGMMVTATYVFNLPGGAWDYTDNGTYTLTMEAGQVFDTDGPNAVPAGPIGKFDVGMPVPALVVDNVGDAIDFNYGSGQLTLREAIHLTNYSLGTNDSISFAGSLTGMSINLGSALKITDPLQITGLGAANLTINAGGNSRVFEINVPGIGGNVSVADLTVTGGNATSGIGGGITLTDESLTLTGMVVTGNSITGAGGGIGATGTATITVGNSTISNNTASTTGAGIHLGGVGAITINNSTLNANQATTTGGAIHTASTVTLDISDSTISNNSGSTGGGVRVINTGSTTTVTRSTVSGNMATASGGGFYISGGTTNISYSTFSGNIAGTSGGGIGMSSGTITLTNSTISGNTANGTGTTGGGGISGTTAVMNINNSTITGNMAPTGVGGGIRKTSATGTVTLQSTIVGANSANAGNGQDIHGTVAITVAGDNNLVQDNINGAFTLSGLGNVTGMDPLLQGLTNNGGPTQTHALQNGSPASNAGNNLLGLTFDQRGMGNARVQGGVTDIGAYEGFSTIPSAVATAPNVPPILSTVTVTVTYTDETGIDATDIDVNDIKLSGVGYPMAVSPISATPSGSGMVVTGTYVFNAPAGGWDGLDNGKYTITMQANEVFDTDAVPNPVFPGPIGSFTVAVPLPPLTVNDLGDFDDMTTNGVLTLREALRLTNNSASDLNIINFDPSLFTGGAQSITLTMGEMTISKGVTITGPGMNLLTVSGNNTSRVFNITGTGSFPVAFSDLTVANGNITSSSSLEGANIQIQDETVTLTRVKVANGLSADDGGGISVSGLGTLIVEDSLIVNNVANSASSIGDGGGINFNAAGTLVVRRSSISGNTADDDGGGIHMYQGGSLTIEDSTVSGNTATSPLNGGGGIYLDDFTGTIIIRNSTFSGNVSGDNGGAIVLDTFSGTLLVQNSTFTGNSATLNGGAIGITSGAGTVTVESSIIFGNTAAGGPAIFTANTVNANVSLISSAAGITTQNFDTFTNTNIGVDPMLGLLQNNGGPTETHALQMGSPAKNNGSNPANLMFDQRGTGFARNSGGGVDIGAFEIQAATPPQVTNIMVNDGSGQRSLVTSMKVSFSEAVNLAAGAFVLQRYANGTAGTIGLTINQVGGDVTLTFNNTGTIALDPGSSLPDGTYELTIVADNVTGTLGGGTLDGNKNGTAQGSPADDVSSKLHRLFGDADGNGSVTAVDFNAFRLAYGTAGPSIFDFDAMSGVTAADFNAFRLRYGLSGYQP